MKKYDSAVEKVYEELNKCIIIGLTGRTGSGCSSTSKILKTDSFDKLDLPAPKESNFSSVEERKYAIIHKYMKNNWIPFTTIEVSSVILSFVFEKNYTEFINYLEELVKGTDTKKFRIGGFQELKSKLEGISDYFSNDFPQDDAEKIKYCVNELNKKKQSLYSILNDYSCYESTKSKFYKSEEKKSKLYTYLMQLFGNNIRSSGNPFSSKFDEQHFYHLASRVSEVIDAKLNIDHSARICIDALRNPYEVYFFKDKYKSFYLMSVTTDDKDRRMRLSKFDQDELFSLDAMEYPVNYTDGKIFYQQSIAECLQITDIHLYNPNTPNTTYHQLTQKLIRYISLMLHPGLITPTSEERCMQIAYNAKSNSGCLSRQVGSVITDNDFYIKAVGWNDVPEGQIPCNLRTLKNFFSENDNRTYSEFELTDNAFRSSLGNLLSSYNKWDTECKKKCKNNYNTPYCFKDIYNGMKKDKNQVFTRSLHAEENAFLQISKFGGQGIQGGKLFVTASPCELCSKKAYQLGIKDIYYIDPYPGIASSHILKGSNVNNPTLHLFYGAIGNAYVLLYTQRFAIKDELELVSAIKPKESIMKSTSHFDDDYHNNVMHKSNTLILKFKTRTNIEFIQQTNIVPLKSSVDRIPKVLNWSGSSYDKTVKNEKSNKYTIQHVDSDNGTYKFNIKPTKKIKVNTSFAYNIKTLISDENEIMNSILSHHIKVPTKRLCMEVHFNKETFQAQMPKNLKMNLYADIDKNIIYKTIELVREENENYIIYKKILNNPILLYTYSIEWDFCISS